MQQVANGTIKMPPEKLVEIARRVQADQTNLDLQARGAQQFAQKYGDNNMKAYQQSWNANADSKIFEGINIINNEPNPKKINEQLTKLFPTEAKRATFLKKYRNIKSLAATGLQAEPLTKEDF
jgi:phosphodiesterase/alkaline phosphatase D-like protein